MTSNPDGPEFPTVTKPEFIGPTEAAVLLATSPYNRNLNKNHVATLVRQMVLNAWKDNGQTINIDVLGRLMNGHHRLTAIIESGTYQWLNVCRGVDPDSYPTMDQGLRWTPQAVGKMAGYKNHNQIKPVLETILEYREGTLRHKKQTMTPGESLEMRRREPGVELVVNKLTKVDWRRQVAAVLYLATCDNPTYRDRAVEFISKMKSHVGLEADSPILTLDKKVRADKEITDQYVRLTILTKCWNAFAVGQPLSRIVGIDEVVSITGAVKYGTFKDKPYIPRDAIHDMTSPEIFWNQEVS